MLGWRRSEAIELLRVGYVTPSLLCVFEVTRPINVPRSSITIPEKNEYRKKWKQEDQNLRTPRSAAMDLSIALDDERLSMMIDDLAHDAT